MTKYSKKQMKKLRLYDVRLKGHPAVLVVENNCIWKCKKCASIISGVRIPALQGTKRGKFTLRLLQSIYEKKIDGERSSVIAEAYGVRINTINKLAKEYLEHVEKFHEAGLKEMLSVRGILQKEKVRLRGRDYWAVTDVECDK